MAYSGAVGYMKEHPQFFVEACNLFGIPAHSRSVVFVDDALANVETARRHGWTGIHHVKGQGWQAAVTEARAGRR